MFRQWCKQKGFANNKKLSHVLMDGGVLSIPSSDLNDFYDVCVSCVNAGEKIFVVEQKTEFFNFFVDIDYQDDEALSVPEIRSISEVICQKIQSFKADAKAIVTIAAPKPKGSKIKTGVHINWPGLVVNQHIAVQLMHHLIEILNSVYSANNWRQIVDQSVYGDPDNKTKGSGFRMPWSHKKGKHDACAGKGCEACDQKGKVIEGEYLPVFQFEHSVMRDIDQEPTVERLWMTTVRTEATQPTDIEVPVLVEPAERKAKKEGDFTKSQTKNEVIDSELIAYLQTFVRQYLTGQASARILQLFKSKTVYYVKTDSKYCENLGRSHSSNHVWFSVSDKGTICQKCFCRCETTEGRRYGFCRDFKGREHNMTSKLKYMLFPDKKMSKNIKEALCLFS